MPEHKAQTGTREVPSHLLCGWQSTAWIAQKLCSLPWRSSKAKWPWVQSTLLLISLLEHDLGQVDPEVPANFNNPVIYFFYIFTFPCPQLASFIVRNARFSWTIKSLVPASRLLCRFLLPKKDLQENRYSVESSIRDKWFNSIPYLFFYCNSRGFGTP